MRNIWIIILFVLTSTSCNFRHDQKSKDNIIISDSIRIDFFNQILSDTTKSSLYFNRKEFISNIPLLPPPYLPTSKTNSKRSITETKYISILLKEEDSLFIKRQRKENLNFRFEKLSKYNFKILDVKEMLKNNVGRDSILNYTKAYGEYGFLSITPPVFNRELNRAYVRVAYFGGESIIYKRINNKWIKEKSLDEWIE